MNFSQIKTFYLVATMGTFQSAADKLNTSQPAVSARIVALENWFGVQLFDRSTHRAQLTPQGRALLEISRKLLELEAAARSQVGGQDALHGIFRIGAADTLAMSWLPSFLTQLQQHHPAASFEFQLGTSPRLHEELTKQTLDVCFMVGPVTEPYIVNLPLCETPVVIAAAPSLGLHGRRVGAAEIAQHPVLTFERRSQTYQSMVRAYNDAGLIGKMTGTSSLSFAIALTLEGYGVLAAPRVSIRREVDQGFLKVLDTDIVPESPKFALCYVNGPAAEASQRIGEEALEHLAAYAEPGYINLLYGDGP